MTNTLSALEQVKATINPYAGRERFARLAQGTVEDITPEDDVAMRWHGLYPHRPLGSGRYMLRVKLPGGFVTSAQLETMARVAESHGHVNLTTRQDIEFHQLTLAALPATFHALEAAGITSLGACGDQVRNVITCPAAGIDPHEAFDTTATAREINAAFLGNPAFANLPRKFKISICGCARHCVPTAINDLGLVAARHPEHGWGYRIFLGGGLSVQPAMAQDLCVWIPPQEALPLATAAVSIFREEGNRQQRSRARLKHLIAEKGAGWFLAEVETRLGRSLTPLASIYLPAAAPGQHLGIHQQAGENLHYVGVPVPAGSLTTGQLREVAYIAATAGSACVRITHEQNILLPAIPARKLDWVLSQLADNGLPVNDSSWAGRLVVCIGKAFCTKAATHTKQVAIPLAQALDRIVSVTGVSLRMSGCPNNCGGHSIADIGLQGCIEKSDDGPEERFHLLVGGGAAVAPQFGQRLFSGLRADELEQVITDLISRFRSEALAHESFSEFAYRVLIR